MFKYLEIFYSIQGEGYQVGHPSVFLRLFGCNFQCPMFGQDLKNPVPNEQMPHNKINPQDYQDVNDLPIFSIGCDTYASWHPGFKHLVRTVSVEEMVHLLIQQIPDTIVKGFHPDLVITGGEPLIRKNQDDLIDLLSHPDIISKFSSVTFETNGTFPIEDVVSFNDVSDNMDIYFMVSPKLSNSGVPKEKALNPLALKTYDELTWSEIFLKFVIRSEDQISEIDEFIRAYENEGVNISGVYLMPEGGTQQALSLTELEVANLCMKYGYWYSPRLHCNLFGNNFGT